MRHRDQLPAAEPAEPALEEPEARGERDECLALRGLALPGLALLLLHDDEVLGVVLAGELQEAGAEERDRVVRKRPQAALEVPLGRADARRLSS